MSATLLEVFNHSGYAPTMILDDANWLLSKRNEFDELIEKAEALIEANEAESEEE